MNRAWLLVVVCACGDNFDQPAVIMDVGDDPPAYGRAPFPNDAVRDGAHIGTIVGLDAIARGNSDLVAAHVAALDGWGLRPVVEFFIEGALDPATVLEQTSALADPIVVLDLATGVPVAMDWRYDAVRSVIIGSPTLGTMLLENEPYAAVITSDIHGLDGTPVYGGVGLGALTETPPARWMSTAIALSALSQYPALTGRIQGITVFTTQAASSVLVAARDVLAMSPAPQLAFDDPTIIFDTPAKLDALLGQATRDTDGPRAGLEQWGTDNPTGIAHDHVGVVATGTMTTTRFRQLDDGSEGPDSGTFVLGADGVPLVQSIDTIPITFVLPKPKPSGNNSFPVVIFGHGLGGSRADVMNLAEPLTSQGYAIVAIDMWGHGSRYDPTDVANNFAGRPGFTGDPTLRDGFGDTTGEATYIAFFENFENVSAVRDSIRQSAIDFAGVATVLQTTLDLSALAAPYGGVAPTLEAPVGYLGESFGTLVGTDLAAIEPSIDRYVLDVPGGGVLDQIIPGSAELGALALPLLSEIYRTSGTLDRFHPLIGMLQAVLDGADPLTFAPHVLLDPLTIANAPIGPRAVLCIEAMTDETMATAGTTALARAFGLAVLEPSLDPPSGLARVSPPAAARDHPGVLVQYEPATHGRNWSALHGQLVYVPGYPFAGDDPYPMLPVPIAITEPIYATQAQVAEFLSNGDVISTQTPIADFDGDGVPDDVDPYPFDPTR